MNDRPTPESTAARRVNHLDPSLPRYVVDVEVCERLERQRDEAREQLEPWQKLAASSEILRKKAESQRNGLMEALEACREDACELLGERGWWKDEERCHYRERYEETAENIVRADIAIAAVREGKP